ncbi:MAG: hypothetical protein RIS97_1161 [Pseudomonadota bacterium]
MITVHPELVEGLKEDFDGLSPNGLFFNRRHR